MGKRQREDDNPQETGGSSVKARRVEHKLKLGATKLGHAFKIAKGFERQKLGRRQKTAVSRSDIINVERIDAEIEALKKLNSSAAAQHHLYKTLSKIKTISEHPDLPQQVNSTSKSTSDAATLNVVARLCKSNQAKTALDATVIDIQKALGVDPASVPAAKRQRKRLKTAKGPATAVDRELQARAQDELDQPQQFLDQSPDLETPKGTDSDGEPAEDRASRSQDEIGEEFSDVDDLEQRLLNEAAEVRPRKSGSNTYDVQADFSLSESDSEAMSTSPEPQKAPTTKKTSFLPSLTMGGYISGSDSEAEDIDIAPKKNRRGQRARQQIWEQKYGNSAKHLQKPGHAIEFDRKRGAVEKNGRSRCNIGHERRRNAGSGAGQETNAGQATSKPVNGTKKTHRDDGGALHPSWEAAKKAKEKKEAPVAFSGKKTTFD